MCNLVKLHGLPTFSPGDLPSLSHPVTLIWKPRSSPRPPPRIPATAAATHQLSAGAGLCSGGGVHFLTAALGSTPYWLFLYIKKEKAQKSLLKAAPVICDKDKI